MTAYYNEIDPFAAAWLRELIRAGHIAPGDVDERDIRDVTSNDLASYDQCHFFAGIGTWSYALRQAGWADDRPVWTGSCPCQPFSSAGTRDRFDDERHLWPAWFWLISQSKPGVVFGEQVASRDGLSWLDLVQTDLENAGYALGALDLCAAGFGAPHLRQRLYFVADASGSRRQGDRLQPLQRGRDTGGEELRVAGSGAVGKLGNTPISGDRPQYGQSREGKESRKQDRRSGVSSSMADATGQRVNRITRNAAGQGGQGNQGVTKYDERGPTNGFWRDADWLPCRDGKYRAVEPGTFPLAHGAAARVVCVCAECETEVVLYEDVYVVRKAPVGFEGLQAQKVLQQRMLQAAQIIYAPEQSEHCLLSGKGKDERCDLQGLREICQAGTSHRWEPIERWERESDGIVSQMPSGAAPEIANRIYLRRLWKTLCSTLAQKPQEQDLFCPVCERVGPHLCSKEMGPGRVGRLRGYGNAIVAPLAAEFVAAYMDLGS